MADLCDGWDVSLLSFIFYYVTHFWFYFIIYLGYIHYQAWGSIIVI